MVDNVSGDVAGAQAAKAAAEAADAGWRDTYSSGARETGSPLAPGLRDHAPNNADWREVVPEDAP